MESNFKLGPITEFRIRNRNLPHWEDPGSVYFVAFHTKKGVILSDAAKDITFSSIVFHSGEKYKLFSCAVLETHAHSIFRPLKESGAAYFSLGQIMHSIKSYSANRIQRLLNVKGEIWLDEYYDRIVRDDTDYLRKMEYVIYNPVRAGLVDKPEDYRWLYWGESD